MDAGSGSASDLVDHAFRHFYGQIVARLTRTFGSGELDLVEESTQEAFLAALRTWPFRDPPEDAFAWLLRTSHNRAIDRLRRRRRFGQLRPHLDDVEEVPGPEAPGTDPLGTSGQADTLRLIFLCCHPALNRSSRVTLTLKAVCGFTTREIASAFGTQEATIAQRVVRSKRFLREQEIGFEIPTEQEWVERIPPVLDVLFLTFNEGYRSAEGPSPIREDLVEEALRLAEILAETKLGKRPEIAALRSVFWLQSSRLSARLDAEGAMVPLARQDRTKWDRSRIARGLACLAEAAVGDHLSDYHLLAEIAAGHATSPSVPDTDWARILQAYEILRTRRPSFVLDLNRAIALSYAVGAEEGLEALTEMERHASAATDPLFVATRADLLARVGRTDEAVEGYRIAAERSGNEAERKYLHKRCEELSCQGDAGSSSSG